MARSTKAGHPGPAPLPLWRLLAVSAVALTTANCAQNTQKFAGAPASGGSGRDPKYGVKASPRLYNEGDVIPKGGGRRFSGKPYVVAGRTYVPREDAKGYVREGLASWYGAAFHGRLTANGEVFDRNSIAAAHPTLPLPSYARVTNLANGHSMIVRVNDRGPYHANRLMDVSEEVAQALEFRRSGTARVRVEYAGKASTAGSDDRKLLATLRTDGQPAAIRGQSPVMLADLGPDAPQVSSERLARATRPALAFKEAGEREADAESANPAAGAASAEAPEAAPATRPARPAPVLVASAATVAVPAALQPTANRDTTFRPVRHAPAEPQRAVAQAAPLSLTPPPLRLAGARPEPGRAEVASRFAAVPSAGKVTGKVPLATAAFAQPARPVTGKPESGSTRVAAAGRPLAPLQASARSSGSHPAATRLAAQDSSGLASKAGSTPKMALAPRTDPASKMAPPSKAALARLAADATAPKAGGTKAASATRAGAADRTSVAATPAKAQGRARAQFAEAR
ncbi:septal ring lytic transglycosylase RlpA family protein [Methylobacterium goesingense]|uniref:Endolytic peptidoglycan transglycosylase RlpA n=2 Tax=Methylobacterium goesingense TaxID=243690 RepID=A0ABV2L9V1_9HYPH|nr:septal ring lytic transglycosylase RlpA family protein [Methylobacterium goesingense]GJD74902.1 Endolytic peptidoglycan transglycosylase RlpA [Methylobacterium goesingense]